MWARRLGVPPLWPSRVKVFFLGLLTSVFIFSVFQYLHYANFEYLDLETPVKEDIVCKLPNGECQGEDNPVKCMQDTSFWQSMNLSDPCPQLPAALENQTCKNPLLPLSSITGDLASLHTVNGVNTFRLWSFLFLGLTSLLGLSITIHDLALLEESLRPKILSIPKMRYATPRLWHCLWCFQCKRMKNLYERSRVSWYLLFPFWALFQIVAFMVIIYPLALLVCLVAPVRMSRVIVFLSAILCMLWAVVFVTVTVFFDTQAYAVLWSVSDPPSGGCVCLCEFPLSKSVVLRICVLGGGVCWHSFNLTFRALKGLRRGQWANMFSVLYAVPIEAFPVCWSRPPLGSGKSPGAVKWRNEGEPVQAEPAFDPFCLMDEQPESGGMRALITSVPTTEKVQFLWEPYTGMLDTEIGCCGFPLPVASWGEPPEIPDGYETSMESRDGFPEVEIKGRSGSCSDLKPSPQILGATNPGITNESLTTVTDVTSVRPGPNLSTRENRDVFDG